MLLDVFIVYSNYEYDMARFVCLLCVIVMYIYVRVDGSVALYVI